MIKLLACNKNKITKDKNGRNMPHLEINEVVVHCKLLTMIINKIQESCIRFLVVNSLVNY